MAQKDHYAGKHAAGARPDPRIAEALRKSADQGEIRCAEAFAVAERLGVTPAEVGRTLDLLEMRIVRCQLGLFGYRPKKRVVKPAESVAPDLARALGEGLDEDRLPCATAWSIAQAHGLSRLAVAAACEAQQVKISRCQLGAF